MIMNKDTRKRSRLRRYGRLITSLFVCLFVFFCWGRERGPISGTLRYYGDPLILIFPAKISSSPMITTDLTVLYIELHIC